MLANARLQPAGRSAACSSPIQTAQQPLCYVFVISSTTAEGPRQTADALVIPVYEERLVRQLFLTEELHVRQRRESVEETGKAERLNPQAQTWVRDELPSQV